VNQKFFYTYTAFIKNIPQTKSACVFVKKIRHDEHASVKACWGSFLTLVVTRVNMEYM